MTETVTISKHNTQSEGKQDRNKTNGICLESTEKRNYGNLIRFSLSRKEYGPFASFKLHALMTSNGQEMSRVFPQFFIEFNELTEFAFIVMCP